MKNEVTEDHLKLKENENAAILVSYASGDGSISFVFQNKYNSDASNLKVTYRDVTSFIKDHPQLSNWKLLRFGPGMIKAYQPLLRISADELVYEGRTYFYTKNSKITAFNCYQIFTEDKFGKTIEVQNQNIKSAISFWLDNVEGYVYERSFNGDSNGKILGEKQQGRNNPSNEQN